MVVFGNNGPLLCQSSKEGGFGSCAEGHADVGSTKEDELGQCQKQKLSEMAAGLQALKWGMVV